MSQQQTQPLAVIVIIPTRNRTHLLVRRALAALERQTVCPRAVIVVDDAPEKRDRQSTRNVVNDLRLAGAEVVYLENSRERGLSGAINTGVLWAMRRYDPSTTAIACLDDDDEWTPDHLELCRAAMTSQSLDVVIPGITRIEREGEPGHDHAIPGSLNAAALLAGNPHLQGSSIFVRSSRMLEAGLMDEGLPSTTDRDLYLRLAALPELRVGSLTRHTVRHFAEHDRARLSRGPSKHAGLDAFFRKHRDEICATAGLYQAFLDRNHRLFAWKPSGPALAVRPAPGLAPTAPAPSSHAGELVLVAGVIVDPAYADRLRKLLDDLLECATSSHVTSLDLVVLENGPRTTRSLELAACVDAARSRGLSVFLVDLDRQRADAAAGYYGADCERPVGQAPIAIARRMLCSYLLRLGAHRPASVLWFIDDDMRLDNRARPGHEARAESRWWALADLKQRGVSIALGTVSDSPPVPFSAGVRVQMVDLEYNLRWLRRCAPDAVLEDRASENDALRGRYGDYYYDLSRRDTGHLESPFWLEPAAHEENASQAFVRMAAALMRMFAGEQVFRPLLASDTNPLDGARPSIQCGGNTFVFDHAAMAEYPHTAPTFGGQTLRRSDMNFALYNRYGGGRRVLQVPVPVRHDRSSDRVDGLDLGRLVPDMRGFALYSALEDVLVARRAARLRQGTGAQAPDDLDFTPADVQLGVERFEKYLGERWVAFAASFWRIMGTSKVVRGIVEDEAAWWHREAPTAVSEVRAVLDHVDASYTPQTLADLQRELEITDAQRDEVRAYLEGVRHTVQVHRAAPRPAVGADDWVDEQRLANARAVVVARAGARALRLLGMGSEGVALTDERSVYKVTDYAKRRPDHVARSTLERLVAPAQPLRGLYPLHRIEEVSGRWLIEYDYEASEPYRGGCLPGLVDMLRSMRRAGVVSTNIHPKNMVIVDGAVKLIDYGVDFRPASDAAFLDAARRAFLSARYAHRADLGQLMRRATNGEVLTELAGFEAFWRALTPPTKAELVDGPALARVRALSPSTVLDFGCGRGEVATALAADGAAVTAYDPGSDDRRYWTSPLVRWCSDESEIVGPFDVITCNLVLCVIADEDEYERVLSMLRRMLRPGGRLVLSVCHPLATHEPASAFQTRSCPTGCLYGDTFTWTKRLPSGAVRSDVHRPTDRLLQDLSAHGLVPIETSATTALSLTSLLPEPEILFVVAEASEPRRGERWVAPADAERYHRLRRGGRTTMARAPRTSAITAPLVLMYHRVLPDTASDAVSTYQRRRGLVVSRANFARQLDVIARRLDVVGLDTWLAAVRAGEALSPRACVVTFDDGFRDFVDHALPELAHRQLPAALFPTVAGAESPATLAPVEALYARLGRAERRLSRDILDDWALGQRKRAFLRSTPDEQRALLDGLGSLGADEAGEIAQQLYLDRTTLARLPHRDVVLGCHGVTHALMTTLADEPLERDLSAARSWLAAIRGLAEDAQVLAFPNGTHDARVLACAERAGFELALTVERPTGAATVHPLRVPRVVVGDAPDAIEQALVEVGS